MAGKSNRSKNKVKVSKAMDSSSSPKHNAGVPEPFDIVANGTEESNVHEEPRLFNGPLDEKLESTSAPTQASKQTEGELHLYPVSVKSQTGEKLELQLSPGDSVMDVRQFLLDAPETCYFTCYDLIMHTKDETAHSLEDYNEISEVADITTGGCSVEMIPARYDDRSIRSHIRRARDLLSAGPQHSSLSTVLAFQREKVQKTDAVKVEVPELDGLGFMDDVSDSLGSLISTPSKDITCLKSIILSSFNPPPSYRRLVGDLIYIDVETLEGSKLCITGSTRAFYVNSSSGNILDPRPNKQHPESATLIGLLQRISSKFKKGFREILDWKSSAHPFENVQSLLPPNSWLGRYPIPDHKRDTARAEDALALTYGTDLVGMQRDWNEELQSCREFPHKTPQERILRDRALYKVSSDFVDAATKGAVGVINRCIAPINPTDPECFHMYVHNNIFFSFAVDADLEQISKAHTPSAKGKLSQNVSSIPILQGEVSTNVIHETDESGTCRFESSNGKPCDHADSSVDLSAEAQMADGEQATYASANNDLKGTRAYQEADVSGLYNLAMAIVDYRGHRVVAQSIIPGILQGDKSDSLLYGSVDNGKKISWNETFHSKVLEAAKHLHIKEHMVLDGCGNAVKLAAPVECKGIVGSDDRHYILDLMRVTPRDVNYSGPGSRFCVLRPELVTSFCQYEAAQSSKSHPISVEKIPEKSSSEDVCSPDIKDVLVEEQSIAVEDFSSVSEKSSQEILLNPNVFTEFKLAGTAEEIAAEEASVRKASSYLVDVILLKFVQDLCSLEVSPMDGNTLTDALHAHGINIRYLGRIAKMTKHLHHLWGMCTSEIVVRTSKHIIKEILREAEDHDLASAIAHSLNCLFGNVVSSGMKGGTDKTQLRNQKKEQANHQSSQKSVRRLNPGPPAKTRQSSFMLLTSDSVWCRIQEFAKLKYQFELPDDARLLVRKVSVIRNLCLKLGISVVARKYDLGSALPFHTSDIFNLQPVVKHSVPVSSEARDLIETGKARLAEGLLNEAYMLFFEAFSLLQQVTGPMHVEVANCCRYLAMILYHAGDMAGAITQQHKELIINERCLGLDHPDTAHSYGNMALFYHGLNQPELALQHMSRTLLLLGLSSGPDHPDVAATFINVAMMYQDIGKMQTALRYLQEALTKNERLLGSDHTQTAVCHHALAITWNCMGNYRVSLQQEKKAYDIFVKKLGKEDSRTRDSQNWINIFEQREKQAKQPSGAANNESPEDAIKFLKAHHPHLLKIFQEAVAAKTQNLGASSHGSGRAPIHGSGVDERAARAAADARKKAAAKGIPLRHEGFPASHPQIAQLLNTVNASAASAAATVTQSNEGRKEQLDIPIASENGASVNAHGEKKSSANEKDLAPVGLGTGLSSLESKKQKQKSKAAA